MSIGTMGVKLLDGGMPVESILMQNLVSWESVDATKFRLTVKQEGKKKNQIYDFGTSQGPEICECMLDFAKMLAAERKRQIKAEKQARAEKAERKEEEAANAGGGAGARGSQSFDVTQTHWKKHLSGPSKGNKIPREVRLEMSQTSIRVMDGYTQVADISIQSLMSWETITDDDSGETIFRLVLKPDKKGSGEGTQVDFGAPRALEITEMLLGFAKDLAALKKQQKAERKRREAEAEAAAKPAAKLTPRLIAQGELGESVTNLYLDTFKEWRE